jgi:predicted phage terminase large subunit-like protein
MEATPSSNFNLPPPYPWQAKFIEEEKRLCPRLSVLCVGRQSGKTFLACLWAILAKGGLLQGGHVCWLGPGDKAIAQARSWIRRWLAPLIVEGNPGQIGYDLSNGGRIDFWSCGPNAKMFVRGRSYSLCVADEGSRIEGLRMIIQADVQPALSLASGRILIISTPRGRNDFHDYYREAERAGLAFHAPSGPDTNPSMKASEFEHIRRTTAPIIFEEEYEARFVEMAGCLVKREYLRKAEPPPLESFLTICFGIDVALAQHDRSDFSALVVTGIDQDKRQLWVLMARRWRKTWPESVALLADYNRIWKPQICVCENVAFQELGCRDLIKVGLPLTGLKVSKGKEERFLPVLTRYAIGEILHSDTLDNEFEAELLSFPEAPHDDYVDALTYGVGGLVREIRDAWNTDQTSGRNWGNQLAHEKPEPRLYHDDGSYDVIKELADGQAEMVRHNPDGSEYVENWYHKQVGDEIIIYENDVEVARHPKWHLPILLEARRLEYQKRFSGGK